MVGGPYWDVPLGRKDDRSTNLELADANIPGANEGLLYQSKLTLFNPLIAFPVQWMLILVLRDLRRDCAMSSSHQILAALNVFTQEPPAKESKLVLHEKVTATPHLGASTMEAQEGVAIEIAESIIRALNGELAATVVNAPMVPAKEFLDC